MPKDLSSRLLAAALGGLLVIAGYGDDALGTRYLHLEVCIVGNCHEFGQGRSAKQCMVRVLQVHHFKPDRFPAEMLLVPKKYINLDLANGGAGQAGYDAMEHSPSRHELLHLDV